MNRRNTTPGNVRGANLLCAPALDARAPSALRQDPGPSQSGSVRRRRRGGHRGMGGAARPGGSRDGRGGPSGAKRRVVLAHRRSRRGDGGEPSRHGGQGFARPYLPPPRRDGGSGLEPRAPRRERLLPVRPVGRRRGARGTRQDRGRLDGPGPRLLREADELRARRVPRKNRRAARGGRVGMESRGSEWAYANNGRIAAEVLGFAILLLGIGLIAVIAFGADAVNAGVALLAIATFLLVFSVLVFLPRLARRGSLSFSVYSRRSIDDAEKAVREVLEEAGRTPRVAQVKSRSNHPPRIVTAEGILARFRIEVTRHPATADGGPEWTEIVESFRARDAAEARALRDKITERLGGAPPPEA